jgi:alginate O-acetyltransferase complex protein AlgI
MFPQLVAGPIVRAIDLLKQLTSYRIPNNLEKWNAIKLICFGLFQKVVIADNLSYMIDSAYENKSMFDGTLFWWIIAIAFSFQIYCDFSGYSLIARGIAKYMGYHFKMNFNHPYLSTSLRMFWQRWHISLSTWFRDYVYIPLGGSRNGVSRSLLALTITMLLSGLWHGANYTFIIWALLHILFLILERYTAWIKNIRYPVILILIVFAQVTIAWVYFRASNIEQANEIIKKLFLPMSSDMQFFNFYMDSLFFLLVGILIEAMIYLKRINKSIMIIYRTYHLDVIVVSIAIVMIIFLRGEGKQFIYFQF